MALDRKSNPCRAPPAISTCGALRIFFFPIQTAVHCFLFCMDHSPSDLCTTLFFHFLVLFLFSSPAPLKATYQRFFPVPIVLVRFVFLFFFREGVVRKPPFFPLSQFPFYKALNWICHNCLVSANPDSTTTSPLWALLKDPHSLYIRRTIFFDPPIFPGCPDPRRDPHLPYILQYCRPRPLPTGLFEGSPPKNPSRSFPHDWVLFL